jgi:2-methylcitrate dehydratase
VNAVSNAWLDGGALRAYRHAPNTGSRKSWAAGDATSRGVRHALFALAGEMGYPSALSAQTWGFEAVLFKGRTLALERSMSSYVMENVLFKISFPAEFHAQTAVEAALKLHAEVASRLDAVERIEIETQEAGVRIIDKTGPLANPADRDHCLQYMVAVPLIFGRLTADDYEDAVARDPRIDALRAKMVVAENSDFSRDYLDPDKRAIGNALRVSFKDGTRTARVAIDYPVGHRRRRVEGIPLLLAKFNASLATRFGAAQIARIEEACADQATLEATAVDDFVALWVSES